MPYSMPTPSPRKRPTAELYIFFSIFLIGLVFLWIHTVAWVVPQWKLLSESVAANCTILETRIETKSEDDSVTLYRPEIRIKFASKEGDIVVWTYDSDTLTRSGGFSTNRKAAENVVAQYEIGKASTCWYHPDNPEKAVLKRETSVWGWYFLAIPVCLAIFGLWGIFRSFQWFSVSDERKAAKGFKRNAVSDSSAVSGSPGGSLFPTVPDSRVINESPGTDLAFRLPTTSLPSIRLVVLTIFTIVWNAICWTTLVWSLYHSGGNRSELVFATLFGIVFCGIGLFLTIWIIHYLLTAFGIGPTIFEISDHPIYPGRKYRMLLLQTGTQRYRSLNVVLVCEEIARFRQGTDTITSRKEVYSQPLYFREDFETTRDEPLRKEFFIRLPHGAMHSLRLEHNEIVWKVVLHANLINWPELHCECPVIVLPFSVSEDRDRFLDRANYR